MNLVDENLVSSLNLHVTLLKRPLRIGSINDPNAFQTKGTARVSFKMGKSRYEDTFYLAPIGDRPSLVIGTPWLERFHPEIIQALKDLGENPQKHRFHGGGKCHSQTCENCRRARLATTIDEIEWLERLAARRVQILMIRAMVSEALESHEEVRVLRAAVEGDPGIRGLTGNREGWRETIPPEFRSFTESVFSDNVLQTAAPARPGFECVITMKEGETLTKRNPYELPRHQLENLKRLLDSEEQAGVVQRSKAPHAMPGFFVTDPGSKQERWVVDFREVNEKSKKDAYPLPRVNTLIERAAGANFVSTMDISKAFAMIPMAATSKELTAFTTPLGMYEYNVMPMGLANAPSVWQRFMDSILGPISHDFCFAYLDDILIVSKTREEHVRHCLEVLQILADHGLHAKPHKCHWFQKEVEFLGFKIIAGKGVTMADDKIQAIRDMKSPEKIKDLRTLLGVFGYNEGYAKHYSDLTACMTDLLKKDVPWDWTPEREAAFQELKRRFMEKIIRTDFNPEYRTRMKTDSSDVSHAIWIEQLQPNGEWATVLVSSHKFKDAEKGWDGPDKELFAIVDAFRRYRKWLSQMKYPVEVYSDHRNLAKFMFTSNLLKSHDGRVGRWWQDLSQCSFEIQYTPGTENVEPDWLSRYNLPESVELPTTQLLSASRFSTKALADIDSWFRSARDYTNIRQKLESSFASRPKNENEAMRQVMALRDDKTPQHLTSCDATGCEEMCPLVRKLNDSPDPVPAPTDASVSMAAPQRARFIKRYAEKYHNVPPPEWMIKDGQRRAAAMQAPKEN